ncbi:MAG: hypothetical protein M5U01_24250 [Ardenticatenaceae bacterium]|nr:hypothetical protein [Ardenticatenaceae bacterium]HBY92754.1 hypothetical protein [Chloroflexota bacterium]
MTIIAGIVIGLLLMIHGFAHWNITTLWGRQPERGSWLLSSLGVPAASVHSLGAALWIAALLVLFAAGVGATFHQGWWRALATAGAAISLLVIALFWSRTMLIGAAVDIGMLVALLWARWPTPQIVGA